MPFDALHINLPITEVVPAIREQLARENTLVVNAPTGAGKSTLLPLALVEEAWLNNQQVILLEPRRLAARTIAARMADLLGETVGQTVGYRIRFDTKVSTDTRITVVTEGILTRMLQSDNALDGIGLVIFDEFHERSIHADLALALCRESQQVLRPDLRMVVMSATLDMPQLTSLLNCNAVVSEGRQYPVEIIYTDQEQDMRLLPELTARTVLQAVRSHEGDVLVFLPGQGEIRKCEVLLKQELRGFAIHSLYGALPQGKQFAAIMPDREGRRKVVLATSIAETSLTIEGIKIVVDSGFGRTSKFDPRSGLSGLRTVQIDCDSADQRAGRAGRLSAGVCYRMWSQATQARLQKHRTPEILEVDLAALALDLATWGIRDPEQLAWLTPPPAGAFAQALEILESIEAIEHGQLTEHGKEVHRIPCHPRIAHMLLMAKAEGLEALATDIAALLDERDPLGPENGIDLTLRVEALRRHRAKTSQTRSLSRIETIASSYRRLIDCEPDNGSFDPHDAGLVLAFAFPERIAHARPGNNAQFKLANGRLAMASHKDDLAHEPWLAVAHVDAREGIGKIFLAAPLNPRDLAPLVKEQEVVEWDTRKGGLIATRDLRIGNIVLQSTPLQDVDDSQLKQAICNAIKREGERLLKFDEHVEQWQNRVLSLRAWNPDESWPDVSTNALLANCEAWLLPYLDNIKKPDDLAKLDLKSILQHSLDFEIQQALDQLAPERIEVPTGSNIKLKYGPKGEPPVLAVRVQEVFGMPDTPRINNGKTAVLMHLLSPGYKPVQVTSDLKNFWNETYFEVRKELRRRYSKHPWPDDPWNAQPIRK